MRAKYLSGAEQDVAEAVDWYRKHSLRAAAGFQVELEDAIQRAVAQPELYAIDPDGNRTCRLKRYPYSLVVRIHQETAYIVAVAHDCRRPGFWRER